MPRRDFLVTVVLGDGPNADDTWDAGIAVAADGNDSFGMLIGAPASDGDNIIGWTGRSQNSGDVVALRTMLDGTISVKYLTGSPDQYIGNELYLTDDGSGRLTNISPGAGNTREIGIALEENKVTGDYMEALIITQKYFVTT